MKRLLFFPLLLSGCALQPVAPEPDAGAEKSHVVFEVHHARQCPPLPRLAAKATNADRVAYTRTIVFMYAQCAKGN